MGKKYSGILIYLFIYLKFELNWRSKKALKNKIC